MKFLNIVFGVSEVSLIVGLVRHITLIRHMILIERCYQLNYFKDFTANLKK